MRSLLGLVWIELLGPFLHFHTCACAESLTFNHGSGRNHTRLTVCLTHHLSVSLSLHSPSVALSLFFCLSLSLHTPSLPLSHCLYISIIVCLPVSLSLLFCLSVSQSAPLSLTLSFLSLFFYVSLSLSLPACLSLQHRV